MFLNKLEQHFEKKKMEAPFYWREMYGWENKWPIPKRLIDLVPIAGLLLLITRDVTFGFAPVDNDYLVGAVLLFPVTLIFMAYSRRKERIELYRNHLLDDSFDMRIRMEIIWSETPPVVWIPFIYGFIRVGISKALILQTGPMLISVTMGLALTGLLIYLVFSEKSTRSRYERQLEYFEKADQQSGYTRYFAEFPWSMIVILSAGYSLEAFSFASSRSEAIIQLLWIIMPLYAFMIYNSKFEKYVIRQFKGLFTTG